MTNLEKAQEAVEELGAGGDDAGEEFGATVSEENGVLIYSDGGVDLVSYQPGDSHYTCLKDFPAWEGYTQGGKRLLSNPEQWATGLAATVRDLIRVQ